MPYVVRRQGSSKSKPYAIVNKRTGRVVGRSRTKAHAQASASIRNRSH